MNQETLDKFDGLTKGDILGPEGFRELSTGFINLMRERMKIDDFVCSEKCLETIDPIIDVLRAKLLEDEQSFLVNSLQIGSYLGETFIQLFSGAWFYHPEFQRWGVQAIAKNNDQVFLNVFHKIKNRIIKGEEDSITYYYQVNKKIIEDDNALNN